MEYDFYDMALSPMESYIYLLVRNSQKNARDHTILIWNADTFNEDHRFNNIHKDFLKIYMPSPLPLKIFTKQIEVLAEGYKRIYQNFQAQIDDQIDEVSLEISDVDFRNDKLDKHQEKVELTRLGPWSRAISSPDTWTPKRLSMKVGFYILSCHRGSFQGFRLISRISFLSRISFNFKDFIKFQKFHLSQGCWPRHQFYPQNWHFLTPNPIPLTPTPIYSLTTPLLLPELQQFYLKSQSLEELKERLDEIRLHSLDAQENNLLDNPQVLFLANKNSLVSFNFAFKRNGAGGKPKQVQVANITTGSFKNLFYFPDMNCDLFELFQLQQQLLEGIVDIYLQIFDQISEYFQTSDAPDQGHSQWSLFVIIISDI